MGELGSFFITIGSKLQSKGFDKARIAIRNVAAAGVAMGTVLAVAGLKAAKAAGIQEQAEFTLAEAMKVAGTFTAEAHQHNLDYASSLQKMTTFGDEAILGVQKMLTNFGVEGVMLDKLTEATLDLAAAKGMDLRAAADLVSKSVGSTTNALTRYGIAVEGGVGSTERMQMAVTNISKLFGGAAQAQANTYLGRVKQLTNRWGDFIEKIGFKVIPLIENLMTIIEKRVLPKLEKWIQNFGEINKTAVLVAGALVALMAALLPITIALPGLITAIGLATIATKKFWATIAAHPLVAMGLALRVIIELITLYWQKNLDAADSTRELGKVTESLINIQKAELKVLNEKIWAMDQEDKRRVELVNRANLLEKSLAVLVKRLEKEKADAVKKAEKKKTAISKTEAAKRKAIAQEEFELMMQTATDAAVFTRELNDRIRDEEEVARDEADVLIMEKRQEMFDTGVELINSLFDLKLQRLQNDTEQTLENEDAQYDARREHIINNVSDETDRNAQLELLAREHEASSDRIKKDAVEKEKKIKRRQKRFSIAEAIINTSVGATKAFAQGGPFAGPFLAAMITALGAVQIAMIKAQKFAHGALAMTATPAIFGEAGPEIALPLNHPNTTRLLSEAMATAGGGGGLTVNITVPPITSRRVADEYGDIIGKSFMRRIKRNRKI